MRREVGQPRRQACLTNQIMIQPLASDTIAIAKGTGQKLFSVMIPGSLMRSRKKTLSAHSKMAVGEIATRPKPRSQKRFIRKMSRAFQ